MSVRAYKLIEIKTKPEATFNCWNEDWLFCYANVDQYNEGGILTIDRDTIDYLKEKHSADPEKMAILKQIMADMGDNEFAEYYCY